MDMFQGSFEKVLHQPFLIHWLSKQVYVSAGVSDTAHSDTADSLKKAPVILLLLIALKKVTSPLEALILTSVLGVQ